MGESFNRIQYIFINNFTKFRSSAIIIKLKFIETYKICMYFLKKQFYIYLIISNLLFLVYF